MKKTTLIAIILVCVFGYPFFEDIVSGSDSNALEPSNEHEWELYQEAYDRGQTDALDEIKYAASSYSEEYISFDEAKNIIYSYYDEASADDIYDSLCDCPRVDMQSIVSQAAADVVIGE